MDMVGFIWLVTVEIEAIRAGPQDSWHAQILPNCEYFRTGIHYES